MPCWRKRGRETPLVFQYSRCCRTRPLRETRSATHQGGTCARCRARMVSSRRHRTRHGEYRCGSDVARDGRGAAGVAVGASARAMNSVDKSNIVCPTTPQIETLTPLVFENSRIEETRLRTKANSKLSKIDLQLLDHNFNPIETHKMETHALTSSVLLSVRRTKAYVKRKKKSRLNHPKKKQSTFLSVSIPVVSRVHRTSL